MEKKVEIVISGDGKKVVRINSIEFKGKRRINWDEVKTYLQNYVGDIYEIVETNDMVYIGSDFPDEYTGSRYTHKLMGTVAKAKANAAQGIAEMIQTSGNRRFRDNQDERHIRNAKYGWYRYDSRFELPVYDEGGSIIRYNMFCATLLVRHAADGKLHLYDILDIRKETSNSLGS